MFERFTGWKSTRNSFKFNERIYKVFFISKLFLNYLDTETSNKLSIKITVNKKTYIIHSCDCKSFKYNLKQNRSHFHCQIFDTPLLWWKIPHGKRCLSKVNDKSWKYQHIFCIKSGSHVINVVFSINWEFNVYKSMKDEALQTVYWVWLETLHCMLV